MGHERQSVSARGPRCCLCLLVAAWLFAGHRLPGPAGRYCLAAEPPIVRKAAQPSLPPLPVELAPFTGERFDWRPSLFDRFTARPDDTRDVLPPAHATRGLQPGGALQDKADRLEAFPAADGRLWHSAWLEEKLRTVPVLGKLPIRRTGCGLGLGLGSWDRVKFALVLAGRSGSAQADSGGPVLSVDYRF
ncbi:MAG: hypothetical protein HY814_08475 [Candidatus Riflebacteria bacterium]|nr:hypothetical protein [Candidatus Riflebacteria bacterium]